MKNEFADWLKNKILSEQKASCSEPPSIVTVHLHSGIGFGFSNKSLYHKAAQDSSVKKNWDFGFYRMLEIVCQPVEGRIPLFYLLLFARLKPKVLCFFYSNPKLLLTV
ncbi:hypothetical protein AVEN_32051-1 [Araneus ventricosus]|uniref:Uncharacterized protein n=1 Tax=Araneus ventricosus TaxID=182803 RepID=A0A4Y2JAP1_ARAVE|nr:hypothetical protein AVEN_32051-1 [Araneus ventricosus]